MSMNVVEASGLGKRYGSTWALCECTLAVPAGHVVALVRPNGAGRSTRLNLAVGLAALSAGTVTVLGGRPGRRPRWTGSRSSPRTCRGQESVGRGPAAPDPQPDPALLRSATRRPGWACR
jgi:energy-coupling factor transporter ATP-binding protein EcfA2